MFVLNPEKDVIINLDSYSQIYTKITGDGNRFYGMVMAAGDKEAVLCRYTEKSYEEAESACKAVFHEISQKMGFGTKLYIAPTTKEIHQLNQQDLLKKYIFDSPTLESEIARSEYIRKKDMDSRSI